MKRRGVGIRGCGRAAALVVIACCGIGVARAQAPSVGLDVLSPPQAVAGSDGETHLVYELRITNTDDSRNVTPTEVVVSDPATRRGYVGFEGTSIRERLRIPNQPLGQTYIPPGQWGAFFVHVSIPRDVPLPGTLQHLLGYWLGGTPDRVEIGGETKVNYAAPVVFGPPLRGSGYIAGDGCCDAPRHVMALLNVDGAWWNAQRYAIDWEQLDTQNRLWVPQPGRGPTPQDFHIYGKDLLAVADARVVAAVDGLPDQPPHHPDPVPEDQADGNHVILDVGGGVYVLYAHIAPHTVAVGGGQSVTKGQLLGKVGNSGHTLAPHLHLQAMDRPSSLAANGVPYVFERFQMTGFDPGGSPDFQDAENDGTPATIIPVSPPSAHAAQLPLNVTVVDWMN